MTGLTFGEFLNLEVFKAELSAARSARAAEIKAEHDEFWNNFQWHQLELPTPAELAPSALVKLAKEM